LFVEHAKRRSSGCLCGIETVSTTTQLKCQSNSPRLGGSHSSHHLKLVEYLPPGGEPHTCAAIWRKGDYVHLASPLLRMRHGVRDPQAYARQFPDALASLDTFEETMTWLDAACYAATDPREVEAACQQHPEWQLRCIQYDCSDAALLELGALIRAAESGSRLPVPILRDCLLEIIKQIFKSDPELVDAQIDTTFHQGDDVAKLELGLDCAVLVTLLTNIASTDLVRQGLLAHHRMTERQHGWEQCLLVLPDLEIDQPMFVTPRVAMTGMEPSQIRASLVRMAKRCARSSAHRTQLYDHRPR
jgi:hypothetical protein